MNKEDIEDKARSKAKVIRKRRGRKQHFVGVVKSRENNYLRLSDYPARDIQPLDYCIYELDRIITPRYEICLSDYELRLYYPDFSNIKD